MLKNEEVHEARLFRLILLSVVVYSITYLVSFLVRGYLPISVVGTKVSRVDFNIYGFGIFINSMAFIIFFSLLYFLLVRGKKRKKIFLIVISLIALGAYFLLLQRFQIIMAAAICFTILYYASHYVRVKIVLPLIIIVTAFFYWITSLRLGSLVATFIYSISKMKFSKDYALLTEPYMYIVMNLENFAHSVAKLEYHTYGYFTFDFVAAATGLKYWILNYFNLERTPFLFSGYNTYTAFWWFYCDFGAFGLAIIPLILGITTGILYYRMRSNPTIKSVTAYGVMAFIIFISYFNFPVTYLWFEYNMLAMYCILRWTIIPRKDHSQAIIAAETGFRSGLLERK
jgi:oligosaccharide repeat unit polymerase